MYCFVSHPVLTALGQPVYIAGERNVFNTFKNTHRHEETVHGKRLCQGSPRTHAVPDTGGIS